MRRTRLWLALAGLLTLWVTPGLAQQIQNSGSLSSTGQVTLDVRGMGTASITVSGTFSGTVSFEAQGSPGAAAQPLNCTATNGTTAVTSTTSAGVFICPVAGLTVLQARMSSYTSGTADLYLSAVQVGGASGSATVDLTGSSFSGNAAASATGSAVPAQADYNGLNIGGTLTGQTGVAVGSAKAGAVAVVDGSGNQITSFGGGTQYANGAANASPTGTLSLGWDGANLRALSSNSSGQLNVIFPSAQSVNAAQSGTWNVTNISGTVSLPTGAATAANQSTGNTSLGNIDSATSRLTSSAEGISPGSVGATTSFMVGGIYNSTPPTFTNTQRGAMQLDSSGNLKVNVAAGSASNAAASATGSAVPASAGYTGVNIGGNLTGLTGKAVGTEKAVSVAIVDASGNQVTSFGGSGGTASNVGSAVPAQATASGYSDGTNMQLPRVFDGDSGAGTQYVAGALLKKPASGGAVDFGTSTDPIRVDPTGTTTQPVSGTVTANAGTGNFASNIAQIGGSSPAASNPLPVRLTDGSSFITTGTDYTHDGALTIASSAGPLQVGRASAAAPTGVSADDDAVAAWYLRNGAQAVQLTASGALIPGDATNGLKVQCASGCSGTSFSDNAAFTFGTSAVSPIAGVLDDTSTNAATENSAAIVRITAQKALHVNFRNASGTEIGTASTPIQVSLANTATNATAVKVDGSAVTQPVSGTVTANAGTGTFTTAPTAATSGGASTVNVASAATNNSTNVKASAGQVYGITLINTTATIYYLRLYNLTTAPTCSSATGYVTTIPLPASTTGAGVTVSLPVGMAFSTGIGYCITGGASSTDNTSAATGVFGMINYK